MKGMAIVFAIAAAVPASGNAVPGPSRAGSLATTPDGCDANGGPYPGYRPPYGYAAYYYGYPRDCGGASITFYLAPTYYGYRYSGPRYFDQRHHGWYPH